MATTTKFAIEDRFAKVAITFSYIMLLLGGLFGFLQVITRAPACRSWRRPSSTTPG